MRTSLALVAALALATAGCSADLDGDDLAPTNGEADETGVGEEMLESGYVPASTFNKSGLRHADGAAGIAVTRTRGGRRLVTYDANHRPLGDATIDQGPRGGPLRIQTLEKLRYQNKTMFRLWAGASSNDGWVEADDVATDAPLREDVGARAGNGAPCSSKRVPYLTASDGKPARYAVVPSLIQPAAKGKRWKVFSESNDAWFKFSGDWDKLGGNPSRVGLMWSWTRTGEDGLYESFAGGGVIRTEILAGETFTPCKVMPVKTVLRETDEEPGSVPDLRRARRLTVYAAYGRVETTTKDLYGWTILAEVLAANGKCTMHVRCEGGRARCPELPLPSSCAL